MRLGKARFRLGRRSESVFARQGSGTGSKDAGQTKDSWEYSPAGLNEEEIIMLHYAVVFLIVAIIAAILGFGGIAGTAAWIAKILFLVFLVLFLVSMVSGRQPKI